MSANYSIDIQYAFAQLGLTPEASSEQIWDVVANARAYRFSTRAHIDEVERFALFFAERDRLGTPQDPFEAIRKAYYKQAMALHPDRNQGNAQAEEELKTLNAAYETIEDIHIEAKAHFAKSESIRRNIEIEAREQTRREAEAAGKNPKPRTVNMSYEDIKAKTRSHTAAEPQPPGTIKYMAASVPRFIRASRLFYLGRATIIGSYKIKSPGNNGLVYDVIMLPELEFRRARLRLSIEGYGIEELTMSKLTPPYIPMDTKEVIVPPGERDPKTFAKSFFMKEYGFA